MKNSRVACDRPRMRPLILILTLALTLPAIGQEPAEALESPAKDNPSGRPAEPPPLPEPTSDDAALMRNQPGGRVKPAPEPSLVPDSVIPGRGTRGIVKGRSTLKPPTTSADLDARIRFRKAHSRALNDPAILSVWEESRVAKTDYRKREALRRYYTMLSKRMLAFDKGIAPLVEERTRVSLRRLDQTRVDPTDPLDEEHRNRVE